MFTLNNHNIKATSELNDSDHFIAMQYFSEALWDDQY